MFRRLTENKSLRGFTLIELAIVLGIVGVMSGGLYRLMSSGNQQTKDQAAAQQQLVMINAVKGFLADASTNGGAAWLALQPPNQIVNLPLPASACTAWYAANAPTLANMCNFLPAGFTTATTNPYGQGFKIQVKKDGSAGPPQSYSFMIVDSGTTIPDPDGSRISALIGGDGGFLYSSAAVCGTNNNGTTIAVACGTMGSWQTSVTAYGYTPAQALPGAIASLTLVTSGTDGIYTWLARVHIASDTATSNTFNTMTTNLFMGNQPFTMGFVNSPTSGAGAAVMDIAGGAIQLDGGKLDMASNSPSPSQIFLGGTVPNLNLITGPDGFGNPDIALFGALGDDVNPAHQNSLLNLTNSSCTKQNTGDGNCQWVAQFTGDVEVSNLLQANSLYAVNYIYSPSDIRLKKDVKTLSGSLSDILKIRPVSFTYKKSGKKTYGVIAQELEKIFPLLVGYGPEGFKAVEYDGLIGPLVESVQELSKQNDELRAELEVQKEREDHIEQQLNQLLQK